MINKFNENSKIWVIHTANGKPPKLYHIKCKLGFIKIIKNAP